MLVSTRVTIPIGAAIATLLLVSACGGGVNIDPERADALEAATDAWFDNVEALVGTLSTIVDEASAISSLGAVRSDVNAAKAAVAALGDLDSDDLAHLKKEHGLELRELRGAFETEQHRLNLNGEIPQDVADLIAGLPEYGPR
jgi:hypothetical protein